MHGIIQPRQVCTYVKGVNSGSFYKNKQIVLELCSLILSKSTFVMSLTHINPFTPFNYTISAWTLNIVNPRRKRNVIFISSPDRNHCCVVWLLIVLKCIITRRKAKNIPSFIHKLNIIICGGLLARRQTVSHAHFKPFEHE